MFSFLPTVPLNHTSWQVTERYGWEDLVRKMMTLKLTTHLQLNNYPACQQPNTDLSCHLCSIPLSSFLHRHRVGLQVRGCLWHCLCWRRYSRRTGARAANIQLTLCTWKGQVVTSLVLLMMDFWLTPMKERGKGGRGGGGRERVIHLKIQQQHDDHPPPPTPHPPSENAAEMNN